MARDSYRLLVVDDEYTARRSLTEILRLEGYLVESVPDGASAIDLLGKEAFDLVLLDLKMPGIDGLSVLHFITSHYPEAGEILRPMVIMLTAHGSLESAIDALRHGAHDYLLKPSSPEQVLLSITRGLSKRAESLQKRALIEQLDSSVRRLRGIAEPSQPAPVKPLFTTPEGIAFDLARRKIYYQDQVITLTPTEGKLMSILTNNPQRVYSHRELVYLVQGYNIKDWEAPEVLRPLVSRLRKKLATLPGGKDWIVSVRGTGYVFEMQG